MVEALCTYKAEDLIEILDVGVFVQVKVDLSRILTGRIPAVLAKSDSYYCIAPTNCIPVRFSPAHFSY